MVRQVFQYREFVTKFTARIAPEMEPQTVLEIDGLLSFQSMQNGQ
jgi:hypothetical protein